MKVPIAPRVAFQPTQTPELGAPRAQQFQDHGPEQMMQAGAALRQAGTQAIRIEDQIQSTIDTSKAKEADSRLADSLRDLSTNPESGFLHKQGKSAVDAHKDALAALEQQKTLIASSLENDWQRELYLRSANNRIRQYREAYDGHYVKQGRAYELAETAARASGFGVDMVNAYFLQGDEVDLAGPRRAGQEPGGERGRLPGVEQAPDQSGFQEYRSAYLNEMRELARKRGLGPEATKQLIETGMTNAHSAVFQRLLDGGAVSQAKEYLETHGGEMSFYVRSKFGAVIKKAGLDEQGYLLADRVIDEGGTVLEQLEKVRAGFEGKAYEFGVMDKAIKELKERNAENLTLEAAAGNKVLDELQNWAKLNRGRDLSALQWARLEEVGVKDDMELFLLQGGQWVTTGAGYELLDNITDQKLLGVRSFDLLRKKHRFDLSEKGMAELRQKWESVQRAASSAAAGAADKVEPHQMSLAQMTREVWRDKSELFADPANFDKGEQWRLEDFEIELNRLEAAAGGFKTQKDRDAAVRGLWYDGGVVDGRWLPKISATREEKARMKTYLTPAVEATPPLRPVEYMRPVSPTDFDYSNRFADKKKNGFPDWSQLDAMDSNPASASDGMVIIDPSREGDAPMPFRDLGGKEITTVKTSVPSYEDALAQLMGESLSDGGGPIIPTKQAVEAYRAGFMLKRERELAAASGAQDRHNRIGQMKLLRGIKAEVEAETLKRTEEWVAAARAPYERLTALTSKGGKAHRMDPLFGDPIWSVRMPDGSLQSIKIPGEWPSLEAIESGARADVLYKNRVALSTWKLHSFWGGRPSREVENFFAGRDLDYRPPQYWAKLNIGDRGRDLSALQLARLEELWVKDGIGK